MEKKCTLKFTLAAVTLGPIVGVYFSLNYPSIVPAFPFTEHYQSLFVFFSFGLLFKESIPLLTPFISSLGLPPFLQEFFQVYPFDLGTWKIAASLPFTVFLVFVLKRLAERRGIKSPTSFLKAIFSSYSIT